MSGTMERRRELNAARLAKYYHENECPLWDYESDGGCEECARHAVKVRELRASLARAIHADGRGKPASIQGTGTRGR